jgi:hypothetical protein
MPGEEAILGGETGDGEDFNGLICDQRREHRRGSTCVFQNDGRDVDDAAVTVTERTIGTHELPDAVAARGCR